MDIIIKWRLARTVFKNPYLVPAFAIIVLALAAMQILTLYPGMPAKVVEKNITSRMERWLR